MRIGRTLPAIATAGLALALSGCISIQSEKVTQSAPGVVTLDSAVCISDDDADVYVDCQSPANVAEGDNFGDGADNSAPVSGQMLVGFRVPDGTTAPDSFQSAAQDTTFNRSDQYSQQLASFLDAVPGEHWVGYLSGFKTIDPHNQPADRSIAFDPPFALAPQAGGAPFAGPLHWRLAVGFRALNNVSQSGDPVDCTNNGPHITFCVDSPVSNPPSFPADLQTPVSDFGVLPGGSASAGQGTTATLAFPVRFLDGGNLGAQQLALTAGTTVPGAVAAPATASLHIAPGTTPTVSVSVRVPASTPLGAYRVTLSAADAVVRSNTATLDVVDTKAPDIRISTPAQGATITRGAVVRADYACTDQDNASGVRGCSGPVAPGAPIDTATVGTKTFTVNAVDNAGNASSLSTTYTVTPSPPPAITLTFTFKPPRARTTFLSLLVKGVPRGATVTAVCHSERHARCPAGRFVKRRAHGNVRLTRFVGKAFPAGVQLDIRVSEPGTVAAVKLLAIRRDRAPALTLRCLPPGARRPVKCR